MSQIKNLCVYCGSRAGDNGRYQDLAEEMGKIMAANDVGLVYGGGSIGLMGVIASTVLREGGRVIGVIPEHLDRIEVSLEDLEDLRVVGSMHERKKLMFDLSDGFVSMPGGLGTLDETFEIMTWAQLGLHRKPLILVNECGYWDPLIGMVDHVIKSQFASESARDLYHVADHVTDVLSIAERHHLPTAKSDSDLF